MFKRGRVNFMKNEKTEIYVVTHKKFEQPKDDMYIPIQAGASINENLGYLTDNVGDNISEKNKNYCELTALYWMWKNCKADIVGLTHYRRYFFKKRFDNKIEKIIDEEYIKKILNDYDLIIPEPEYVLKYTVGQEYKLKHHEKDLKNCRNIVKNKYPEYLQYFDKVMDSRILYQYNMLITNKKLFDNYCTWLFDILFELEKITDLSGYDDYNKRIYGFLSERLFNVWLLKNNNLKIKELPVNNIDSNSNLWQIKNQIKKFWVRR